MAVSKVLHVIPSVGPLRGGPSAMVRQLAGSLARSGIETHIATTNDDGPEKLHVRCGEPVVQDGVTYWYFPRQVRFYTISWPLSVWLSNHVSNFDLLHIHALFSFAAIPASYWATRRGVPYIVRPLGTLNEWGMTHRRPWLKKASFRLLESRILKRAALVHYTSDQERHEAETLGVTAASAVIPIGLPDSSTEGFAGAFRRRYPQLRGRRIILFLSRLDQKKGLDLLLRAFADVRRRVPNASLVIAGDGQREFVGQIKSDAKALGIAADIVWTGFLAGEDKQAALAEADVFALPSYSENFGMAVAECMAARLPVVISDQVGIHQEVSEARAGLVVPCDAAKLADALVALLTNDSLRDTLGAGGERLARGQYSSDAVTRTLIGVYNEVVH
jgi:glycosyltransferase involved in cell wall biosynthesis